MDRMKSIQNGDLVGSTPRSQDILQLIQCPLCLEMPTPPIYCCRSGHIVCNPCQERTLICPLCGELYSRARNMVAEKMLEKFTMGCKYENEGCFGKTNLSGSAYFEHINNCDFRPVRCPSCNDGTCVGYTDYLDHLVKFHGMAGQSSPGGSLEYNLDFTNISGDRQKFVWPPYFYKAYNKTFLLRVVGDSKAFTTTISLVGPKYQTANYIASIKLHYASNAQNGKNMEWMGYVNHFRDDPFDVAQKTGQGLVMPFAVIKKISTKSLDDNISDWTYSVDIRQVPKGKKKIKFIPRNEHTSTTRDMSTTT